MAEPNIPPSSSGIYCIRNIVNGRVYVGSAVNIRVRWASHRERLKTGHHSKLLQNSWNRHGPQAFVIEVLELVPDPAMLLTREQHWIDKLRAADRLYGMNMRGVAADSNLGIAWPDEYKAKMRAVTKGRVKTPEHQAKITAALKGRKRSPETIAKIVAANKGRPLTDAERDGRRRAGEKNKGRVKTPEERAKLSAARKGLVFTPEWCANISSGKKGRRLSASARANISAGLKGRVFTSEHRANLSAANRRRRLLAAQAQLSLFTDKA